MAVLEILELPDPRLRDKAVEVTDVASVQTLIDDMLDTMYSTPDGIGLASIQVGRRESVIVIDLSEERNDPLVLINAKIVEGSDKCVNEEGCLSVPDYRAKVERFAKAPGTGEHQNLVLVRLEDLPNQRTLVHEAAAGLPQPAKVAHSNSRAEGLHEFGSAQQGIAFKLPHRIAVGNAQFTSRDRKPRRRPSSGGRRRGGLVCRRSGLRGRWPCGRGRVRYGCGVLRRPRVGQERAVEDRGGGRGRRSVA